MNDGWSGSKDGVQNGHEVTSALYDSGYSSPSRLYESSDARLGMTPGQYRRGGAGASISYTIVDSALGRLLVAATEKGVCRISLADDDATLESTLAKEFPRAELSRDDGRLREWVGIVANVVCGDAPDVEATLPLDVQGTAFQRRVWEALRQIPRGETRTYIGDRRRHRAAKRDARRRKRLWKEPNTHRRPLPPRSPLRRRRTEGMRWASNARRNFSNKKKHGSSNNYPLIPAKTGMKRLPSHALVGKMVSVGKSAGRLNGNGWYQLAGTKSGTRNPALRTQG